MIWVLFIIVVLGSSGNIKSQDWEWFYNLANYNGIKEVGKDVVVVPGRDRIIVAGNIRDTLIPDFDSFDMVLGTPRFWIPRKIGHFQLDKN